MAKLNRERKLREKRLDKQARKEARKLAPAEETDEFGEPVSDDSLDQSHPEQDLVDPAVRALVDA